MPPRPIHLPRMFRLRDDRRQFWRLLPVLIQRRSPRYSTTSMVIPRTGPAALMVIRGPKRRDCPVATEATAIPVMRRGLRLGTDRYCRSSAASKHVGIRRRVATGTAQLTENAGRTRQRAEAL